MRQPNQIQELQKEQEYLSARLEQTARELAELDRRHLMLAQEKRWAAAALTFVRVLQGRVEKAFTLDDLYSAVVKALTADLSVDAAALLKVDSQTRTVSILASSGLPNDLGDRKLETGISRQEVLTPTFVNSKSSLLPFHELIASAFRLPYFVWYPISDEASGTLALFAGNKTENLLSKQPFSEASLQTLGAISSVILLRRDNIVKTQKLLGKRDERIDFLAEIVKTSPISVIAVDRRSRINYLNPAAERLYGYEPGELVGQPGAVLLAEDYRAARGKEILSALRQKKVWKGERLVRRKNGQQFYVYTSIYEVLDKGGDLRAFVGFHEDITERKRVEGVLRESEERLRELFDEAPLGYHELDAEGRIIRVNRTELDMLGYEADEVLGRHVWEFVQEREVSRGAVTAKLHSVKEPCRAFERTLVRKDGTTFPVLIQDRVRRDAGGRVVGIRSTVQDVTERKHAEESLRESEAKFRSMFEGAAVGIALSDMEGRLSETNSPLQEMLGYTGDELRRMCFTDFTHSEDVESDVRCFKEMVAGARDFYRMEKRYVRKDGQIVWAHLSVSLVQSASGGPLFCIAMIEDISERKRAQEELQQRAQELTSLNADLERSNRDLEEFTYAVSHDLQEPLRKVSAFSQFLVEDCGDQLSDAGKDHLSRMQNAVTRMKGLIRHLLKLSRIGTRGGSLVAVDTRKTVGEVLDTLSDRIHECGADVVVADALPAVKADPVQLGRVFQNLISNALKFRAPTRPPRIDISAGIENGYTVFSVADNGIGIEERFRDRIFGVFQRAHARDEYEGDGVGLALCAKILHRHGGEIWVESEVGKGSTFRFALPRADPAEGSASSPKQEEIP